VNGEVDGGVILLAAVFLAVFVIVLARVSRRNTARREVSETEELARLRQLEVRLYDYALARQDSADCTYILSEIQLSRERKRS